MTIFDAPTATAELRSRLEAAGIDVTPPTQHFQWDELHRLLAMHGAKALAAAAIAEYRTDRPIRTIQGFFPCWQRIPKPVVEGKCDVHERWYAGHCPGCRADRLASGEEILLTMTPTLHCRVDGHEHYPLPCAGCRADTLAAS